MSSDLAKERLYKAIGRVAGALASAGRLQILEFVAQGERSVEALAAMTGLSVANTSKHLQALRQAGLVSARKQGWWALPAAVMAADGLTGLLAGGMTAGYTLVLTPALLGFPELNRMVLDLQPPYTTPVVATVTLWALVGIGAVAGGVTGLAGAVIGFPAQLVVWALLMGLSRRHHVRPEPQTRSRNW